MNPTLATTPLHDWHVAQGARLVDFAGWSMPVQYSSIVEEHTATRTAAGVFDVSHMGRLRIDGSDAITFLDRLLTRRVSDLPLGRIRYSLMCHERGGVLDDVLAYHLETPSGRRYCLLVVNASNRAKIVQWLQTQVQSAIGAGADVELSDRTTETAMIAVQGPAALAIVNTVVKSDLGRMRYYTASVTEQFRRPCIVSRTGYTGEDGFELIVRADEAVEVVKNLFLAGREHGIKPAGLGARDTLRLEAAMPLYGHELNEQITPIQAGLEFAVTFAERDFVGRTALLQAAADPRLPRRVGLELEGRRVAREHYLVCHAGQAVGEVTSGTFAPTLQKAIAMAYVPPELTAIGTEVEIDIRGRREPARVVPLPFYTRPH
jgi:aminomethyltransferase